MRATGARLGLRQRRALWAWSALALPLAFFLCIRLLPTLFAISVSLRNWRLLAEVQPWVGLANYRAIFHDEVFVRSLLNTLIYVVVGVPAQLALGLLVALQIQRLNRFSGFWRTVYFMPYVTSTVAVAWVWRWLLLAQPPGAVNSILGWLHLPQFKFLGSPTMAIYTVIAAIVWQGLGLQMILFLAGLEAIPDQYYEAAALDGADARAALWKITIPLLNPTIVFSAVIGVIRYLQTFTEVLNMAGREGGPLNSTKTLVLYVYNAAFKDFRLGTASAATVVLFAIVLLLTLLQLKVLQKPVDY